MNFSYLIIKKKMKTVLKISLLALVFIITSASAWVKLKMLKPAMINIDDHIQSIALVQRSIPADNLINIIEGGLTGEGINQDAKGIEVCMDGMYELFTNSPRFEVKRTTERLKGPEKFEKMPAPLSWMEVERICKKYSVDAVLSLESYDSDFIMTNGKRDLDKKDESGKPVREFYAKGIGSVEIGFRLYDPKEKSVVDQYQFNHRMDWETKGSTLNDAMKAMLDKNAAIQRVSKDAGIIYAKRLTPTWITETRYFYNRPKKDKNLAAGVRKSEVADWEGANDSWLKAIEKPKKEKVRGRAAFNIAAAYEVLGDLEKAKEWAGKAYVEFGDKKGNDYVNILIRRMNNEQLVKS